MKRFLCCLCFFLNVQDFIKIPQAIFVASAGQHSRREAPTQQRAEQAAGNLLYE